MGSITKRSTPRPIGGRARPVAPPSPPEFVGGAPTARPVFGARTRLSLGFAAMFHPDLDSLDLPSRVETAGSRLVRVDRGGRRSTTGVRLGGDLVVTSHRALQGDEDVRALLADDVEATGSVLGRDPGTDLAVLRLGSAPPLHPWSPREPEGVRVGELVLVVARPGRSVRAAMGMIGVAGEGVRTPSGTSLDRWLELDRELPRGFSGGLVVDLHGTPLGIASRGIAEGAGIVVPGSTVGKLVEQIERHGRVPQGYLGVGVYPAHLPPPLRATLGQRGGVAVVSLAEGGPAASAGLLVGDVILQIAGRAIRNPMQLRAELLERSGEPIDVMILRGGRTQDLRITTGTRP